MTYVHSSVKNVILLVTNVYLSIINTMKLENTTSFSLVNAITWFTVLFITLFLTAGLVWALFS